MKIVRMYTGDDGRTHFQDVQPPARSESPLATVAALPDAVAGEVLIRHRTGVSREFHPAPRRQYVALLDGAVDVITTTGERRTLYAGDILAAEDTHGEGHVLRLHGSATWTGLIIPMAT